MMRYIELIYALRIEDIINRVTENEATTAIEHRRRISSKCRTRHGARRVNTDTADTYETCMYDIVNKETCWTRQCTRGILHKDEKKCAHDDIARRKVRVLLLAHKKRTECCLHT